MDSIVWTERMPAYRVPVWGSYTCAAYDAESRKVAAWNTVPALEGIHYAQTERFSIVSNRPLLVAIARALTLNRSVEFNDDFLPEYLAVGFSISGATGYAEVYTAPSNCSIEISQAGIEVAPEIPAPGEDDLATLTTQERASVLAEALKKAAVRSVENVTTGSVQLRMSGGKDSRLLLGLLRATDIHLDALTFGTENTAEVVVARRLCELAGIPLSLALPELGDGKTIRGRVLRSIALGDGHPLSEPHASVYNSTPFIQPGDGLALGQWPLFKGGAARKLRYSPENLKSRLLEQFSPLLSDSLRVPIEQHLLDWSQELDVREPTEILYLFSRNFRSGPWQQALVTHHERYASLAYPISDSEVTSVSDRLTAVDKISNVALFHALREVWPDAVRVPLASGKWPFEALGYSPAHSGEFFSERTNDPLSIAPAVSGIPRMVSNYEFSRDTLRTICQEILVSDYSSLHSDIVDRSFWTAIQDFSRGLDAKVAGTSTSMLKRLVWRVYAAEVWLSREWL